MNLIKALITNIHSLKVKYNTLTKKYYWYQIKLTYKIRGQIIFDFTTQVGVSNQATILNSRKIKKIEAPLHKNPKIKPYLNNGTLLIEPIGYLGYFRQKQ